ncbi:translation initiation factor sui1 protein, partial [Cardiosporidium cionae]
MFKKKLNFGIQNLLGSKDRKKIRTAVLQQFPKCDEETFDLLFPSKEQLKVTRLATNNRLSVYLRKDIPLFVDYNGDLLPTVYALWQAPHILPCLIIPSEVSTFILRGADLMLPGVFRSPQGFEKSLIKGEKWGIRVINNRYAFAVGSSCIDESHILKNGMKGKCLELLHCFGDFLWQMGPRNAPNASFTTVIIQNNNDVEEVNISSMEKLLPSA